jgi:hypothetical protein
MSTYRRLFLALGCASWIVAAGCSDNPVAGRAESDKSLAEAGRAMGLRTDMIEDQYIPAPYPSVTNSNGTPLISWSAVPGATSYTVSMIYYEMYDNINWEIYYSSGWEIATTTDTSYLDTGNGYTGGYECLFYTGGWGPAWGPPRAYFFTYAVQATTPEGTSDISNSQVLAPIGCL